MIHWIGSLRLFQRTGQSRSHDAYGKDIKRYGDFDVAIKVKQDGASRQFLA